MGMFGIGFTAAGCFIMFRGDLQRELGVCWGVLNSLIKRSDCCVLVEELQVYDLIM